MKKCTFLEQTKNNMCIPLELCIYCITLTISTFFPWLCSIGASNLKICAGWRNARLSACKGFDPASKCVLPYLDIFLIQ